jgi:hypothetical protein
MHPHGGVVKVVKAGDLAAMKYVWMCNKNLIGVFLFCFFFDANERRFIAKGNEPTLIRASSRARQQERGAKPGQLPANQET